MRNLYSWVRECIQSLWSAESVESVDAEDMSQYLPDDTDFIQDIVAGNEPGGERFQLEQWEDRSHHLNLE